MDLLKTPSQQEHGSNDALLFVSVYVVLLAFFILLNSISVLHEERQKEAISSVSSTFSITRELGFLEKRPLVQPEVVVDNFFTGLHKTVASVVELENLEAVRSGNTMRLTIPTESLFEIGDTLIRDDRRFFMENLATSLKKPLPGMQVETEIALSYSDDLPDAPTTGQSLEMRRAGILAEELEMRGVPLSSIAVGMVSGKSGKVDFTFFVRQVEKPQKNVPVSFNKGIIAP